VCRLGLRSSKAVAYKGKVKMQKRSKSENAAREVKVKMQNSRPSRSENERHKEIDFLLALNREERSHSLSVNYSPSTSGKKHLQLS